MSVVRPASLEEGLAELGAEPAATEVLAGGTDFMVEVNFGHRRPRRVLALRDVAELRGWAREGSELRLGAGLTYAEMLAPELAGLVPALAQAARTVGSPQIRNAGTLGGNLGTASPAGDALPILAALGAVVVLSSAEAGRRELRWDEFLTGPKRNALRPGELIVGCRVPVLRGPQAYLKVGVRNAMVIAIASLCLALDRDGRSVRCALGSVGPVPLRAPEAEAWAASRLDWEAGGRCDDPAVPERFGELVAEAARPIDDHRSTAAYRRHAVAVLASRALRRAVAP